MTLHISPLQSQLLLQWVDNWTSWNPRFHGTAYVVFIKRFGHATRTSKPVSKHPGMTSVVETPTQLRNNVARKSFGSRLPDKLHVTLAFSTSIQTSHFPLCPNANSTLNRFIQQRNLPKNHKLPQVTSLWQQLVENDAPFR